MKTCSYCGRENDTSAMNCVECGKDEFVSPPNPEDLPLPVAEKIWIEDSFLWLLQEFGTEHFLSRRTILPEQSFFPDKYNGTEEDVRKIVARVCSYMDVDFSRIQIEIYSEEHDLAAKEETGLSDSKRGTAGLYFHPTDSEPQPVVAINKSNLKNPTKLIATIAHELGHVILLGGGRITSDDEHHEDLTDLITVFFGLGIFTANSSFQFGQWTSHSHQGWSASRVGYLSEEMFAYALACYAWMRKETKPQWAKHLSMNVGAYFKKCLQYLADGGETKLELLKP